MSAFFQHALAHTILRRPINDNHRSDADKEVEGMKKSYGTGASCMLLVVNSIGKELNLVPVIKGTMDPTGSFHGHFGNDTLDPTIGIGQTDAALHVHTSGAAVGSAGWAIYRATAPDNSQADVLIEWDVPWGATSPTTYCEVQSINHWPNQATPQWVYDNILTQTGTATSTSQNLGFRADASIGGTSSPKMKLVVRYEEILPPTIQLSDESGTSATLKWPAVANAKKYMIYIDGSGKAPTKPDDFNVTDEQTTDQQEITLTGLTAGTTYRAFALAQRDYGLTSGPSNTVNWKQGT